MDMSMMDMGGMNMESDPVFRNYDSMLARSYWYIIAGLVCFMILLRAFEYYEIWARLRLSRTRSKEYPTRPQNIASQIYATGTAIAREITYPQIYFGGRLSWLSPPSSGRVVLLLAYWSMITYMMTYKAIVNDVSFYERIGYRGAWISVTQVPLVYLLATKSSAIGCLVGSSHERLNWLHRWVSRTLLITVTIHGGHFMTMWVRGGIVELEFWMMPMVKYGIGAWAVLVWTFFTSLNPVRRFGYELFVIQHIASAGVFLWLVWVHVPAYATYNVWFAIAAISFDWILRGTLMLYQNIRFRRAGPNVKGLQRIGYGAELRIKGLETTIITLKDVPLSWKPGQYIYLWIPRLGPLETHPFTIATPYIRSPTSTESQGVIQFAVRAQSGFSKRIHNYAKKQKRLAPLKAFIAGPYGTPPSWNAYETLILVSASTGASFTLPILESVINSSDAICVQRARFLLIVRDRSQVEYYAPRLKTALVRAAAVGIDLEVRIAITQDSSSKEGSDRGEIETETEMEALDLAQEDDDMRELKEEKEENKSYTLVKQKSHSPSASTSSDEGCVSETIQQRMGYAVVETTDLAERAHHNITYTEGRPNLDDFIIGPVELTGGETIISVCGGWSLVADVRNSVASLSNERAVHKGTGAQGIYLHVEEYSF